MQKINMPALVLIPTRISPSKGEAAISKIDFDGVPRSNVHFDYMGRASELPFKEMELTTAVAEAERIIRLKDGPESFEFLLSAIKIGDLVFAGVGGEPFTEVGNRMLGESPFKKTVLCCLTNSAGEYIPTRRAYEEGGYEAKASSIKPGGDDVIVDGMTKLLKSIK